MLYDLRPLETDESTAGIIGAAEMTNWQFFTEIALSFWTSLKESSFV